MGLPLPLLFSAAPLPPGDKTPQQWADDLVARLVAKSTINIAFFVSGATAPTSDVGPWWNTGANPGWYIWDIGTSVYVPMPVPQASLKWYIGPVVGTVPPDPDPAVYSFWIVLNGSGVATDIQTYSGGAWTSIFVATVNAAIAAALVAPNAAIAALQAATPVTYPFRVYLSAPVSYTAGTGDLALAWDQKRFDPNNVFDVSTGRFTVTKKGIYHFSVSAWVGLSSGTPTVIAKLLSIRKNAGAELYFAPMVTDFTGGDTLAFGGDISLDVGDIVDVTFSLTSTGGSVWEIAANADDTYFSGFLVQAL